MNEAQQQLSISGAASALSNNVKHNDLTKKTKLLNVLYALTVLLFLLDSMASFDIKNQAIKSFVYFGILIGTPLTLLLNAWAIKTINRKIIGIILPTIILTVILIVGPMKFLFSIGAWKTQTILYKNGLSRCKTIEFQMQDYGALGYKNRTVEVYTLAPLFIITSEVPKDIDKSVEWVKVDKDVNELKAP